MIRLRKMTDKRERPRILNSTTSRWNTEYGNLYITLCVDEEGQPFEVFGVIGKAGSFTHGMAEIVCRLVSLHLRRGTPIAEIIDQIQDIQVMQPFVNQLDNGEIIWIRGMGDGIAYLLKGFIPGDGE